MQKSKNELLATVQGILLLIALGLLRVLLLIIPIVGVIICGYILYSTFCSFVQAFN